jgi:hypothetical protein
LPDSDDVPKLVVHEHAVLKKFDRKPDGSEWTQEELDSGEAADALAEVVTVEDGVIVDVWRR